MFLYRLNQFLAMCTDRQLVGIADCLWHRSRSLLEALRGGFNTGSESSRKLLDWLPLTSACLEPAQFAPQCYSVRQHQPLR